MADRRQVPSLVTLADAATLGASEVGTKAANLGRLAAAGFPVPRGFVVTPAAAANWDEAYARMQVAAAALGAHRFAVRSSGTAEDLAGASFAGQYETRLHVSPDALPEAVSTVFASAATARVSAYQQARAGASSISPRMAVLVQEMVAADAAGVAFTANPLTGARDEVVITAVRGLGERLVAGEAVGDEWVVHDHTAVCRRRREGVLETAQALCIAALAHRIAAYFGTPQDMEWAITGGRVVVLQARPMTALPAAVAWTPPTNGWWLRNLRLGEWLPEAVTPLCADWLIPRIDAGFARAARADLGIAVVPNTAFVNGWYYTTPQGRGSLPALLLRLLVHPRALVHLYRLLFQITRHPERAAGVLAHAHAAWRDRLLPQYRALIESGEQQVQHASPTTLCRLVDAVGDIAGAYLWSMGTLAGSAWKMEAALARFHRTYLAGKVDCSHQVLLCGLPGTAPGPAPHAAFSADWFWPTAGEEGTLGTAPSGVDRHRGLADRRTVAKAACRAVLASTPTLRRRFDRLLDMAQRAAVVRELQTRLFTLGWPLLRRCALRLGELLSARGVIAQADDVFFLTRAELRVLCGEGNRRDLRPTVASRRVQWARHRQLAAPLDIGSRSHPARKYLARLIERARTTPADRDGSLVGHPASPGRASGPVRLVLGPEDFDRFQPGEVLVARATTPAWTPLFARAAAVVTDGGSLAAHASLVAREYGIPAVVATGDATHRLYDGQVVTVDGGAGMVELVQGA